MNPVSIIDPLGDFSAREDGDGSMLYLIPAAGLALLVATEYRKTPFDAVFDEIGAEEGVGSDLLRAIARQESNLDPSAVGARNANGTRDYGLMQINSVTARKFGAEPDTLVTSREHPDPVVVKRSVRIAARLLKAVRSELGDRSNFWTMIAAYNAGSPAIKKRGIFNGAYVANVLWHHQLYSLGSLLRRREAYV